MSEWQKYTLADVSTLKYGDNLPSSLLKSDGMPVYGANGLIGYYDRSNLEISAVLVSCRGEYSGALNRTDGKAFVTNNSIPIRLTTNEIDTEYLYYIMQGVPRTQIVSGSAQPQVTIKDLRKVELNTPPLPEQRKIARILTTVDELIEKTEAVIAKYEAIKQGMMQDLFTLGVDASGHLRPPQAEAPELYKQSELGWIPKEWEVGELGEEIGPIVSGWSPVCEGDNAAEDEWGVLKTTAVVWSGYDQEENKRLPSRLRPLESIEVRQDDILITRKGPVDRVGVVVHISGTRPKLMIPDTVFLARLIQKSRLLPAFVPLALGCGQVQRDWFGRKIGLADAQVNINHSILRGTKVPIPPAIEQRKTVDRIATHRRKVRAVQHQLKKLQTLKMALMQDLLTGKVRVNIDDEITEDATND